MDQPKPSIGRIVHYYPSAPMGKSFYPAIITHVWSDTCVNLSVFSDGSWPLPITEHAPTSVTFSNDDTIGRRCCWPPRA